MQRIISTLMFLVFLALLPAVPVQAWFFGDSTLVSIDGADYTTEDFKRWWGFWKEEGNPVPETPESYIDWLLLAREGRRMELDTDPGFKRAARVFLQSRALLKLKYEAVDSQINVTDADVKKLYEKDYVPRWGLEGIEFKDEATAEAVWLELKEGAATIGSVLERDKDAGGPVKTAMSWLRPRDLEKGTKWGAIYADLSVGEVVDPEKIGKSSVLWYLKEIKGADDEDFAQYSKGLAKNLWKEQEVTRTRALVSYLRDKFKVKIDEERLDALDFNADEASLTDAPVITSSIENVSEKDFITIMRRVLKTRPILTSAFQSEETTQQLKDETAFNVIAQSVTNWESLDRHYEEKEPFKWEYDFNYDNRLGLSVQQRLFAEQAKVTKDEVEQYYEQNKNRYSIPARVKVYIIDETQGPIDKIWADAASGMSFDKVLRNNAEAHPGLQDVPVNHLAPEVKPVVDSLSVGETSQIFVAQNIRVLVHLAERIPEAVIPFDRIKETVNREIYENKISQLKKTYMETIKASSSIDIDQRQWKAVQKELGGE